MPYKNKEFLKGNHDCVAKLGQNSADYSVLVPDVPRDFALVVPPRTGGGFGELGVKKREGLCEKLCRW